MIHIWLQRLTLVGIFALCMLIQSNATYAEGEESTTMDFLKSISISGFVDTYYSYNFNRPASRGASAVTPNPNTLRAFDLQDNSFTLNNVELQVVKASTEESPVGFGFVTLYGEQANFLTFVESHGRVDLDSFTPGGNSFTIGQGYATYKAPIGKGLDLKMGKFATWIGAELWESVDNPNYSRSFLYQNAIPFTHTGLSASYPFTDKLTITGFFVNGWDTFVDNNSGKTFGYQIAYNLSEKCSIWINASHGPEQPSDVAVVPIRNPGPDGTFSTSDDILTDRRVFPNANTGDWRHFFDFIFVYSPWDKLKFNLNYDHGTEENVGHWHGVALIVQYFFTDAFDIALRGEYFKDSGSRTLIDIDAFDSDGDGELDTNVGFDTVEAKEFTLTLNYKIRNNLYVRPEVRYDWTNSNQEIFSGGTPSHDNQLTTAIGVAYLF